MSSERPQHEPEATAPGPERADGPPAGCRVEGGRENILTTRLRTLVAGGVLESVPASDGSAYREYVLTPKGTALFPVIVALRQWGEQNFFAADEPHSELVDRQRGESLRALEVLSADGRRLKPDDTTVHKLSAQ